MDTFGGVDVESDGEEAEAEATHSHPLEAPSSGLNATIPPNTHPLLVQLHPHITTRDLSSSFTDLVEIAEGESGSDLLTVTTYVDELERNGMNNVTLAPPPPPRRRRR